MLEIRNITKKYKPKKGVPVTALKNVSLQFQDKGMVFVLGKSGSGKSTLLNILGGLDQADSGEIIIKGKSSKDFTQSDFDSYRNTYLGFIFQEYNILEEFTVGANIGLAIELQGKKATDEEINRIMEEVDMVGYGSRKPNELSGGQMQRVAVARALVKNPEIILADEPTGALDSKTGIQVFNTLQKLSKDKLVIVVSHDREYAELYGDRVIELSDGEIISDIEKSIEKPTKKSEGVNIVDDSFIHIKRGYKLTPEDINIINEYIEKSNEDVIISIDQHTNSNIKKFARIDDAGNKEVFKPTNTKRLLSLDEKNPFKLIKSRLPIKDAFKVGASGLRGKPIRLFLTILLSMVSFTLFGLADTMGSYNKVDATVNSIIDSNVRNISFVKKELYSDEWSNHSWYGETTMYDTDIDIIEEKLDISFNPIYTENRDTSEGFHIMNNIIDTSELGSKYEGYYRQEISGFMEISDELLNDLGFSLSGELPKENDEIAITKYIFEHFQVAGYQNHSRTIEIESDNVTEQSIIGKEILINEENYTITGIIDTEINEGRYGYLKEERGETGIIDYIQIQEFDTVIRFGYHALGFVNTGFIENKRKDDSIGIALNNLGNIHISREREYLYNISHIAKLSDLTSDQIYMIDTNKTSLADGETLINGIKAIEQLNLFELELPAEYQETGIRTYADLIFKTVDDRIRDYASNHYQEAYEQGFTSALVGKDNEDETEGEKINNYYEYIRQLDGYYENPFGLDGRYLEQEAKKEIIIEHDLLSMIDTEGYELYGYIDRYGPINEEGDKGKEISIVGFFLPNDKMIGAHNFKDFQYLIVDDSLYLLFNEYAPGPYSWAIAQMPTDKSEIRKIVEFRYDSGIEGTQYEMKNAVNFLLDQVNDFIEQSAKIFLYIGIGFAVFSALLLFNFITASIAAKKREIGILRALGARSSDVFGIFFSESLIIALINFILALGVTIGAIIYINSSLRNQYGLLITFLNFGIRQFFLMILVSVGVALIASFIPVYRIALKKPIDAIRNR